MVGQNVPQLRLEDILTTKQVDKIINKLLNSGQEWSVVSSDVRQAADGLTGFLADHLRVTMHLKSGDQEETIRLFLKRLPVNNQPKADFISSSNYFKREKFGCRLLDEIRVMNDPHPWCPQPLVYSDTLIVMDDLSPLGYTVRPQLDTLDLPHALATVSSIARFHAATSNYETRKRFTDDKAWTFAKEYPQVCDEPTYKDSPWLRCAAKLTYNFLKIFSKKYNSIPNLESLLLKRYVEACNSLQEYEGTLNTLIHKDLWMSNIMFRYEKGAPVNAVIIDYQLLRYGPPAFDLNVFLYLTTTRQFREQYEKKVLSYYFSEFIRSLENTTKERLEILGYDEAEFLRWCEKSRLFGAMMAITNFPYVLMDAKTAQKAFDDPETYEKYRDVDRTEPVVAFCYKNDVYRDRQIEISEEFVERFVENPLFV
ncbi:uncharacterized protein LOC106142321 [Amyelois transitella]|uniref:uncharacterized protein LOC106142321 n=1 Tax=Amyelois transitella TaxID=680683 RepID=UPI00298FA8F8|nr:uncharacterized protein LOC106142321 [Amyelois transitella]